LGGCGSLVGRAGGGVEGGGFFGCCGGDGLAFGPLRYDHAVTVEATVPVGGAIRNPARSLVEQQILLEREGDPPPGTCPASLFAEP